MWKQDINTLTGTFTDDIAQLISLFQDNLDNPRSFNSVKKFHSNSHSCVSFANQQLDIGSFVDLVKRTETFPGTECSCERLFVPQISNVDEDPAGMNEGQNERSLSRRHGHLVTRSVRQLSIVEIRASATLKSACDSKVESMFVDPPHLNPGGIQRREISETPDPQKINIPSKSIRFEDFGFGIGASIRFQLLSKSSRRTF
jgi:hypothetical protein